MEQAQVLILAEDESQSRNVEDIFRKYLRDQGYVEKLDEVDGERVQIFYLAGYPEITLKNRVNGDIQVTFSYLTAPSCGQRDKRDGKEELQWVYDLLVKYKSRHSSSIKVDNANKIIKLTPSGAAH